MHSTVDVIFRLIVDQYEILFYCIMEGKSYDSDSENNFFVYVL